MSVCIVCSAGGHLTEALAATACVTAEKYFVTFDEPHVRATLSNEEVYYVVDPHVSLRLYLLNAWQSIKIFVRKRPAVVISSGAGIALATCIFAKLAGRKLIYIESGARVTTPSRTGRLVYRFADLFIVQWKSMLKHYPRAVYGGPLM
jgi:UDP-N-acetylglucosamine:LPS N-acetylglucosamine transferase